ncbi:hypothetical protein [Phnomibacter ginsenosidimutans]|uniref:Hemerythrin-like domain-containing protein n=1 Tax=Phnomibacter ginsenosidimutans TaxID=2676868 RepID=A0A6I6GBP7_9BACT|nr:hypothetical protein [Phnomibacter ginsenosidimutans]QGW27600.1 hypothetical protein GLV81_05375 [Phnomibacter ginsenosidimutans]
MMASHLVEVNELTPPQLCHYIEQKHYAPIKQSLETLAEYSNLLQHSDVEPEKLSVGHMLFGRLKDEMEQVIRNDSMILFPLIMQADAKGRIREAHIPAQMIRDKNKKILSLLEKLRLIANNFILKPEWDADTRMFFEELFTLDQMVTQAIYLKENVLLPRIQKASEQAGY